MFVATAMLGIGNTARRGKNGKLNTAYGKCAELRCDDANNQALQLHGEYLLCRAFAYKCKANTLLQIRTLQALHAPLQSKIRTVYGSIGSLLDTNFALILHKCTINVPYISFRCANVMLHYSHFLLVYV